MLLINNLRQEFQEIDKAILVLLGQRQELSKKMAFQKKQNIQEIIREDIWEKSIENRMEENSLIGIDPNFLIAIFDLIHKESIRIQQFESL